MKKALGLLAALTLLLALGSLQTIPSAAASQAGHGNRCHSFVDENGDGFNDWAPDADGDGIPNGRDEDFVGPADGSGHAWGCDHTGRRGGFWQRANNMRGHGGGLDGSTQGRRGLGNGSNWDDCQGRGSHGRWTR